MLMVAIAEGETPCQDCTPYLGNWCCTMNCSGVQLALCGHAPLKVSKTDCPYYPHNCAQNPYPCACTEAVTVRPGWREELAVIRAKMASFLDDLLSQKETPMFQIMRCEVDGETHLLPGDDEADARASFGDQVKITHFFAWPADAIADIKDDIDAFADWDA